MSKRSFVAIALLLGASLVGCQTTGLAPQPAAHAPVSTSLGAKDGGTIVVRLATQSALRIMSEAVKLADVDHYTIRLYQAPAGAPNPATDNQVGATLELSGGTLTGEFKDLPLGEYYLAVDAWDATGTISLVEGGGPVLSGKVDMTNAGIYSLAIDVQLRHASGGDSTITITAPPSFTGTKSYGLTLVDKTTREVVSHYRSNSPTVQLKALKDGDYDLWIYVADGTKATPARPFPITVSGETVTEGGTITAVFDPKIAQVSALTTAGAIWALAVSGDDQVYATFSNPNTVYNVTTASRMAGGGPAGDAGHDVVADLAPLGALRGIAVDSVGQILVADEGNRKLRRIAAGKIYTELTDLNQIRAVGINGLGSIFYGHRDPLPGTTNRLAELGVGEVFNFGGTNFSANIAIDTHGNIYYSTGSSVSVRVVKEGNYFGQQRAASSTFTLSTGGMSSISGVAVDGAGNLYLAGNQAGKAKVTMIPREDGDTVFSLAGGGATPLIDGVSATTANIDGVGGLTISPTGKVYMSALAGVANRVWLIE